MKNKNLLRYRINFAAIFYWQHITAQAQPAF